jgi:peptidoglycan/LPS O-acetylase OafA/YrhL
VLSGYLVCGLISERESYKGLIDFYERRARRILPLLVFVMLVTTPFAWVVLTLNGMKDFSQSLIANSVGLANHLFARENGYFDSPAELKPLLNTWSLSVELQFYAVAPVIVHFANKFSVRTRVLLVLATIIITYLFANHFAKSFLQFSYYLLPFRIWEFMIGYLSYMLKHQLRYQLPSFLGNILAISGLALLFISFFLLTRQASSPSLFSLIPTLGTSFILYGRISSRLFRSAFESSLLLFVGRLSFGIYLWHYPVIALTRNRFDLEAVPETLAVVLTTLVLSLGGYICIEGRFQRQDLFTRDEFFKIIAVMLFITSLTGISGHLTNGFIVTDYRSGTLLDLRNRLTVNYGLSDACEGGGELSPRCFTTSSPEVLVWGDSYAMHIVDGMIASNHNVKLAQATYSLCAPIKSIATLNRGIEFAETCVSFNESILKMIRDSQSIRYVVLSSQWSQLLEGNRLWNANLMRGEFGFDEVKSRFLETINEIRLAGKIPVLIGPTPGASFDIGYCLSKAIMNRGDIKACNFRLQDYEARNPETVRFVSHAQELLKTVDLSAYLCPDGFYCEVAKQNIFFYRDAGHLSVEGSRRIGTELDIYNFITRYGE